MSFLLDQETLCPFCEFPNQAEVWSVMNVKEDPELKDLLLGGELNMTECESCRKVFYVERMVLYHDPDRQLMAFVYPAEHEKEVDAYEKKTADDFAAAQASLEESKKIPYPPVTMFGLQTLVNYVEWDEEMQIQGEIVRHLSASNGWTLHQLSPAAARAIKFPALLPSKKGAGATLRDDILAALGHLESINDRLTIYNQTRARLLGNPTLQIPAAT